MSANQKLSDQEVIIQVKDLKKTFGDNQVLNGITTDIRKGEVVVVIGPSGSGKSCIPPWYSLFPLKSRF